MQTEKQIAYTILNSFRGSHSDNNELLSLRQIRSWVNTERANILLNFTDTGRYISEENYQSLGEITFGRDSSNLYYAILPKIIYFNKRTGIKIRINGEIINMSTKYNDEVFKNDYFMDKCSRAFNVGTKLYIRYFGDIVESEIKAEIDAVLFNPSDAPDYNWEEDVYPINGELLKAIKEQAKQSEQIILNPQLEDKVQDTIRDGNNQREVQSK